jgi:hypothetical protein
MRAPTSVGGLLADAPIAYRLRASARLPASLPGERRPQTAACVLHDPPGRAARPAIAQDDRELVQRVRGSAEDRLGRPAAASAEGSATESRRCRMAGQDHALWRAPTAWWLDGWAGGMSVIRRLSAGDLEPRPLPPTLAQELGLLWAQVLVAEYQRRREVAAVTVESPRGSDRLSGQRHTPSVFPQRISNRKLAPKKSVSRGDVRSAPTRTTRLEHIESPVERVKVRPAPEPMAENQPTADRINEQVEHDRRGEK